MDVRGQNTLQRHKMKVEVGMLHGDTREKRPRRREYR
jgi:hypothetical protein